MVFGVADLANPSIVTRLKAAYQAGNAVALTNATAADVEQFKTLLGYPGGVNLNVGDPAAELVIFRRFVGTDGQAHYQSSVIAGPPAGPNRMSPAAQRRADLHEIGTLSEYFAAIPQLPDTPPSDTGPVSLLQLAASYESNKLAEDSNGDQVQVVNTVWEARAFASNQDYYYVLQEVDYFANSPSYGSLAYWLNSATNGIPSGGSEPAIALIQTSPGSTMESTTVTSSVSKSISETVGVNGSQGLNASTTSGVTITNSKTVTIPPIQITNASNFESADPIWSYRVNELPKSAESITFCNQWIWVVPFGNYISGQQSIQISSSARSDLVYKKDVNPGRLSVTNDLISTIPLPFGQNYALQQPQVTSVSPTFVEPGEKFTINGTGLYPSLVTGVLINGVSLDPANYSTVSDTQITAVAPSSWEAFGIWLPVKVQTTQGVSNDGVTIMIL
jgi:hypothetical protein